MDRMQAQLEVYNPMNKLLKAVCVFSTTLFASYNITAAEMVGEPQLSQNSETSPWRMNAGVMIRHIGATSFSAKVGAAQGLATGVGPETGYADRSYDDGFVNQGAATPATGLTTFFEYQDISQVSGGNLVYTATGGTGLSTPAKVKDDDDDVAAPYIGVTYTLVSREDFKFGVTVGFSAAELDSAARSTIDETAVTTVDSYALGAVVLLGAPYTGTFAGPGPLIDNVPTDRVNSSTLVGTRDYRYSLDTDLYSLVMGGDLSWDLTATTYLRCSAGVIMNIADWSGQYSGHTVAAGATTVSSLSDSESDQDVLWGFYSELGAGVALSEQWSFEGFFRYDWSEDLKVEIGSSKFETSLTGPSVGLGFVCHF